MRGDHQGSTRGRARRWWLFGVALLIAGCSDDGSGGECASDVDCPGQQVCESKVCVDEQPTSAQGSASGCSKDTDCKGERICVASACMDPEPTGGMAGATSVEPSDAGVRVRSMPVATAGSSAPPPDAGSGSVDANSGGPSATIKFCHELLVDGVQVTLTLEIAGKSFPAFTGECSPCDDIPADRLLPFRVLHPSGSSVLNNELAFEAGDHVLFGTFHGDEPVLRVGTARGSLSCETVDPFGAQRPDD